MLDKKRIKDTLKEIIKATYSWLRNEKIRGKDWLNEDLEIDDDELGYIKAPIQDVFNIDIRKREIRGCIDVNDLVDLIYEKIIEQQVQIPNCNNITFFYSALFSMAAKLAKADGQISKMEVDAMENVMTHILEFDTADRKLAISIWNDAKNSNITFEDYAYAFMAATPDSGQIQSIFEILFYLAATDKKLHPAEEVLIKQAAYIFGLPNSEFERLKNLHFVDTSKYYTVLGCSPTDSIDVIRIKYKKLLLEWHPDRIEGKSLPPDMVKFATTKAKEIIEAFEAIERERGLRN